LLSAFRSTTGRNQPSTAKFIFGTASWLRCLIQPAPGWALAYIDWSQQEFGIAAFLSGDLAMQDAYRSSDPYLAFAKRAGVVPGDATKESHPEVRRAFKLVVLAVGYGMTSRGLAQKLGTSVAEAEALLQMHQRCYPGFWKWSQGAADFAQLHGRIHTRYGWGLHFTLRTKDRSVRNFPCQANGAEMMRLAAIYATSAGIKVCAPVHDAFLIEAPETEIVQAVARMQACMARASAGVLSGFELNTEAEIIRYPERFGRGNAMWDLAMEFLTITPPKSGKGAPPQYVTPV
jgi:DNA polymerase I-like protein with 3'-5' exonuclease and polymerase domains